jgi:DNA-binding transcriptional LysR family regulator
LWRRGSTALYITPSGLGVLIRELETQFGFRLFDRTTRHVGLTSSGSELLGVVRESLEKLDAAVSQVGQLAAEASPSLSVGAPPLVAADVLPARWGIADGCVCPVSYFEIQSALHIDMLGVLF